MPKSEPADGEFRLEEEGWNDLITAASELLEMLQEDIREMQAGAPVAGTNLAEVMPRRFIPRYDLSFAGRLVDAASSLRERLIGVRVEGWSYPYETFLTTVAEEMLMDQVIQLAIERSGSEGEVGELETLREIGFEDRDFEWLYDLRHDGVTDDPEVAQRAGLANLRFEDWFKPFRDPVPEWEGVDVSP